MKESKTKKLCVYAVLTAAALVFGYVELLFPLDFIAPGMKLGIANAVALYLICRGRRLGAFAVNTARILLGGLLFATPFSLLFSATAGFAAVGAMCLASKSRRLGVVGISAVGSLVHNLTQLAVAVLTVGGGVWFYLPFLLLAGTAAGVLIGFLTYFILQKTARVLLL